MHLKIFVSYRRSDSADIVGRIVDHLMMAFGEDSVFHDIDSISVGGRFKEDIDEAICGSDVFLAIIGDRWMDELASRNGEQGDASGAKDYVMLECETALNHVELSIIPVLVGQMPMPEPGHLPEGISKLSAFNAATVRSGGDFRSQMKGLIDAIKAAAEEHGGTGDVVITIRFRNSGKTVRLKDSEMSLLELAERHGIDIPTGCLMGVCGTCMTAVRSGKVAYDREPEFPLEDGVCLPCIAKVVGDVELDL